MANDTAGSTEWFVLRFDDPAQARRWVRVNDGVMGGLSQCELAVTPEGTALFRGHVSLANAGGFASVRTAPYPFGLGDCEGLILRVRGDGHRYQLRLRTDANYDGVAYQARFDTQPGVWHDHRIPFVDCVATFRGWRVPDAPPLDGRLVQQIGLMIADKQPGPFALEIAWVKGYVPAAGGGATP